MNKRLAATAAVLIFVLGSGLAARLDKVREKDLAPVYQEWLKLTATIILPAEKDVFLSLSNDRERDIFIEAFWKQRDPTPGTPQNEYKEEILKRFQYVNKYFRRGATGEGWNSDMGQIYMILGAPTSIERFEGFSGIYPAQVWTYYGDKTKGLPANFVIVFFQRGGGAFKLYNPVSDGPESLIIDTHNLDVTNHQAVYEKIRELAPTLASASISLIPGQIPYGYMPSPQSAMILSTVINSPRKDVNPAYATHFLNYKGIVSTEYLTNYIESSASVAIVRDPLLGLDFVHFSISPKTISLDYFQPRDQYYCNFKLSVSLRRGDEVVFQYSKDYPFYFPPDRVDTVQAGGVSVLDLFPIAEGTYGLTILLQNAVGKEFSLFEKELRVPVGGGPARMSDPVLGYKLEDAPAGTSAPFKILGRQLLTDPKGTLGLADEVAFCLGVTNVPRDLWSDGTIEVSVEGAMAKGKPAKTMVLKLSEQPFHPTLDILREFPARDLPPDYYEMAFVLKDGTGAVLGRTSMPFIISTQESIPHPVTVVRTLPAANNFLYFYGLAIQYDKTGDPAKAEEAYRRAHAMNPDDPQGIADFSEFLLRSGKFDEALKLVEPLKSDEKFRFEYFLVAGRAQMGKGEYGPAIQSLLEGNRIYDSDTRLLNALGFCYYKTGKKNEARAALAASLRLNPEQPDIKDLAARVEKEMK
jgi:GWxTD domain-containing protein